MRQIVLDTETTGLEVSQGHRIIEIGCVELENRRLTGRHYHQYVNPEREIDAGAIEVHGITPEFLADKPIFARVAQDFLDFIADAELIIHNAPFDVGFLDSELRRHQADYAGIEEHCSVVDTLLMARHKHPGQRNNLDVLCSRYHVDNSSRNLHGALLDAEILADVYLAMTGGQTRLHLSDDSESSSGGESEGRIRPLSAQRERLPVIQPDDTEQAAHRALLEALEKSSGQIPQWRVAQSTQRHAVADGEKQ